MMNNDLGRELGLFGSDPLIGAGLPYWLPAGAAVRHVLEEYLREAERRAGYQHVNSPALGKRELYELSGHWQHYRDAMFSPLAEGDLVLRPSLCPHHCLIYRSRQRSYRELPVRIAELGTMFREEASGVLGGLSRVRAIQLNDGHIFAPPSLVAAEVHATLDLIERAYQDVGLVAHRYRLSLAGPGAKYVDDPELWQSGEQVLTEVLRERGAPFEAERNEAAFYGPKIDIQLLDAAGRESTLSTVQVDAHMPRQFDLSFVAADQSRQRPVIVHRSVLGSLERLVSYLLDATGGAFPSWLAPVQVVVLPVADAESAAAHAFARAAVEAGLRAEVVDADRGTLASRIRAHRLVPYQAVIGSREAAAGCATLRLRSGEQLAPQPTSAAIHTLTKESATPHPSLARVAYSQ